MLVVTKPKRRNRLALPRPKPSAQASTSGSSLQHSAGDKSFIVTTVASSPQIEDHFSGSIVRSSQTQQPGEQLCSISGQPGGASSAIDSVDPYSGDTAVGVASAVCATSDETATERQTISYFEKIGKRAQGVSKDPPATRSINSSTGSSLGGDASTKAKTRSTRVPFQTVQHNAQPVVATTSASESIGQPKTRNGLTIGRPRGDGNRVSSSSNNNDSMRVNRDDNPPAYVQRRRRESRPDAADASEQRNPGKKSRRLWPSGSGSESASPPIPEKTHLHLNPLPTEDKSHCCSSRENTDTDSSCAVATENEKLGEESVGPREDVGFAGCGQASTSANAAPTPVAAAGGAEEAASMSEGDANPTPTHSSVRYGRAGGGEVGNGSGQRCPVCGTAVWGLTVRARQVHINSCLDGNSSNPTRAERSAGEATARSRVPADDAAGGRGERPGASSCRTSVSSTGLAKEPKTEFQADIQMAKALSKSLLVVPAQRGEGVEDDVEEEPQEKEALARDPVAFRAREKKLLARLNDLDQRLERLHKDREMALKKLSAHRALGARVCAGASARGSDDGGEEHGVALKTAEEVVDILFADESDVRPVASVSGPSNRDCVPAAGGTRRGEKRKAVLAGRSVDREQGTDLDALSPPKAAESSSGGESAGEPRLLRRRSSGDGQGRRLSSSGGNTLWGIAQNADELSQSRFVTGVFADVKADAEKARARGLREGSSVRGARAATVTASAYGDPSLYNSRNSGTGPRDAGGPGLAFADTDSDATEIRGASVGADGRDANSGSEVADGKRQCGNDDRGSEQDGAFGRTDTTADEAILLLTQTLSGQRAVPPRPQAEGDRVISRIYSLGVDADACEAERAVFGDAKIAARHIARAPVAAVSRFFPDWEENVRFVFHQGASELRDALESISAALVKEEETTVAGAAAETAAHGENVGRLGMKGDEVVSRTGKAEALLFFEGVILEALELKNLEDGLVSSTASVSDDVDLLDRGVSSAGGREDDGEAVDPAGELCDERVPGGVWEGSEDHSVRSVAADSERVEDNAVDNRGAGDIWSRPCRLVEGGRWNVEDDSRRGREEQSTQSLAARSPNTPTARAPDDGDESVSTTVFLGGDSPSSSRDAIVTLDLTTPGKPEREAKAVVSAALNTAAVTADAPTISSPTTEPTDGDNGKGDGMELGAADLGEEEEEGLMNLDSFWDDPLGFPSPCHGVTARESHASPFPSRSSPQTPTTPTEHQQMTALTAADDSDSGEEEPRSFDLTGAFSTVSSRLIRAAGSSGRRGSPPSMRGDSPEHLDARPTTAVSAESEQSAVFGGGGGERGAENEEEEEEDAGTMPSFNKMTQQELTGMMSVYGLKKKSRRDMVERLKHIWKALHPAAATRAAADVREDEGVSPTTAVAFDGVSAPAAVRCTAFVASSRGWTRGLARAVSAKAVASGRPPLARPRAALDDVGKNDARRDDGLPPCSASRQRPSATTTARAAGGKGKEALGEQIWAIIAGNAQLHEDILLLRTLELTATQAVLKDAGVKCSKRDLASYLDDKGITFVDRGITGVRVKKKEVRRKAVGQVERKRGTTAVSQRHS